MLVGVTLFFSLEQYECFMCSQVLKLTAFCSLLLIPGYPDPTSVKDISGAVSSAGAGLQLLSLRQEISAAPAGDNPAVIIPSHMQVPTPDDSHLSFGSFGPGNSAGFSASFLLKTLKSISDEASTATDDSSIEHLDSRCCLH